MNFDNLVEDAEKHGAATYIDALSGSKKAFLIQLGELQALITQYILADRAASGEAVAWIHKNDECVCYVDFSPKSVTHTASTEPLFTRAIAELRNEKEALRKGFSECFTLWMDGANPNNHALAIHRFQEILCNAVLNATDGDEISDKAISIIMEALTPQPEKEGKE